MIPYLGCHAARTLLDAFLDAELPMEQQVAVDTHLRWCDTCRARVEDLRLIGDALRARRARPNVAAVDEAALTCVQSRVLARIQTERTESLRAQWRAMWVDTRLLWPAVGSTLALILCVSAIAWVSGVVRAEPPGSLAALVSGRAALPAPRPLPPPPAPIVAPEGEAVFLLSAAVVNGGGRVATYELLHSAHEPTAEVRALVDALGDTRFAPKTARGDVVVWLVARTTVRGSAEPAAGRPVSDEGQPAARPARS
jgi:anti-sigma factor RsiW